MREALTAALARLASGPLRERAAALFGALGYKSERKMETGGAAGFAAWLEDRKPLTRPQRALIDDWRDAEIVFQIVDDEIADGQGELLRDAGFDASRIRSFLFAAVDLEDKPWTRTRLAETVRAVNARTAMPVILLFRHGAAATLAVVHRRAHRRDDGRDVLEKVTLVKDVRCARPHRAHLDILADLALPRLIDAEGVHDFDSLHAAWERTLDIEALNRRFYRELFAWFERAVAEARFPDDGAGAGSGARHVIRLVTRLLFIWFLAEKGLAPRRLFTVEFAHAALKNHDSDSGDYYRAVLQNLFFATLNTGIDKRAFSKESAATHRDFDRYRYRALLADPDGFVEALKTVPFVNGGLFDCLDDFAGRKEGGRRIDAFTDNAAQGAGLCVPARLFFDERGLFPLLRRYKFTVEENTPLDREVALDPELLGHVFENLLAAYNPETQETARKATGSYYTPRHVVDYMVGEALVAALAEKARPTDGDDAFWRERLRYLLDYEDAFDDAAELFDRRETEAAVRAIAGLRVLDPAAGSGAFPMGALHKLTLALRRLDPRNELWERIQKERARARADAAFDVGDAQAREDELRDISRTFETYRGSDFGRKLYLIQNGLFGVDIQPVACQIAKLRFFVSLAIEQRTNDDPADNYGIRPLPNLETRFVAADALIGLGGAGGERLRSDRLKALETRLRRVRERYFNARTRKTKRDCIAEDAALRNDMARELEAADFGRDHARAVARWDPYDHNAGADWFDPEWMFGVADGFDVVIGNPPYVRADFRGERHKATREAVLASGRYETLWQKWDMFVPFMERSFKLLAPGGVTSLIVSDAFCHAKYALKAREWFLCNARVERIDFFGGVKLFDAAVHNLSYVFRRSDGSANAPLRRVHGPEFGAVRELSTAPQTDLDERAFFPEDSYRPPAAKTVRLGDLCYVSYGLRASASEKAGLGKFSTEHVISQTKDELHPKRFIQGKHVDRWIPVTVLWLEWGTDRAPEYFYTRAFDELFSAQKIIAQRSPGASPKACYDDGGMHFDASSVGVIPWFTLEGVRNLSLKKQARYPGEKKLSRLPKREALERDSRRFAIKYLLGVMNSSSARDFLRAHRRSNIHLYPDDWKALPIPDISRDAQKAVVAIVDRILSVKRADPQDDVSALERELDGIVHGLYDFES